MKQKNITTKMKIMKLWIKARNIVRDLANQGPLEDLKKLN